MKPNHRIVVSVENNPYCAWQTKLFYYSCVTRVMQQPIIIVHAQHRSWHPGFVDLARSGATVHSAPSFSRSVKDVYPPRNTAGTLIHAAGLCRPGELIVLCDPDMIFVRRPRFPVKLAGNFYSYMGYTQRRVRATARGFGVNLKQLDEQADELSCGVPYVIPVELAVPLAEVWLSAVDAFPPRSWLDIMHAFGFAAVKLNLRVQPMDIVDDNNRPQELTRRDMIHYCYGDDETWDKRDYYFEYEAKNVWHPSISAKRNTVLGEILSQISDASRFYGNLYQGRRNGRRAAGA